ncbi:MAG: hypothetical protein N3H84_06500 [Candidatus Caldarchaeum sp.]|nr:hypothetical protein [Candidatus Caldarchaeum sp.]MCX8201735.1 hypothetical protein [Candidatus Caldarchaeum sp.]MDW8434970.1 hypothetical protein [Candidatus Caldarchaeum sp.]
MPYIPRDERKELEPLVAALIAKLSEGPVEKLDGKLNYVITRLIAGLYSPSYFNYNRALGVLSAVSHELYRRRIAPYEDEKIRQHGDVY